ncbi:hypothetical protein HPP92_022079 [Vanilla planifolia]|uniref:Uncharacterized protein n=1 Tax=Vanilla planifolia TaxID=51239 RepID=A0A835UGW7_VANPL|nr:hypothetical protein HPP92_022079 [Vanilla planifolia]
MKSFSPFCGSLEATVKKSKGKREGHSVIEGRWNEQTLLEGEGRAECVIEGVGWHFRSIFVRNQISNGDSDLGDGGSLRFMLISLVWRSVGEDFSESSAKWRLG